ncbi:MAG: TonB-dependent receptor [Bacteroidetes bacterium]|nr:TonB-dependent receptor [Bacteroidota bacterium]
MPLRYIVLCCLLCLPFFARGQAFTIRGSVSDTGIDRPLWRASVSLINAKDSILSSFTRTDTTGHFSLKADSAGSYFLLIAYPGYADYIDLLNLQQNLNLKPIALASRAHLLQEFVFTKRASAIAVKGDTIEFAADSFSAGSGASVEDMLKRLPGLQVDKDGKITAQGEQVKKVLVDGEEFFSDDPAVVTQNLQAAVVDKVQVYDKKSDQALFTGIDDGDLTKTINLMLKEDKKKGLIGKVEAGGGPSLSPDQKDGFYEGQAMINLFRGKRQLSAFGIASNTGKAGLNWDDRNQYGGETGSFSYDEDEGIQTSTIISDDLSGGWDGRFSGEGLPSVWTGGLHYADKWDDNKKHVSANYRYAKNNINAEGSSTTIYVLPDSQYVASEKHSSFSTAQRQGGNGLFEWSIDSTSDLKFYANGNYTQRESSSGSHSETRGASGGLINSGDRNSSTESHTQSLSSTLSYRKKFAKKGRNLSAQLSLNSQASDGIGYLQSFNSFYTAGGSSDSINQRKTSSGNNFSLNLQLSYTEPLSKHSFLSFRYGAVRSDSRSERFSFNRAGADWSQDFDSVYSSSYGYDVLTQNGAASLRFVFGKYNINVGGQFFHTDWQQQDRLQQDSSRSRSYNNFAPTASLRYEFSKRSRLNFSYSGSTRQPSLDQIQPLRQNNDPLNISIGNPDLRQEFRNNFRLSYHANKPLSGQYLYLSASGSYVNDALSQADFFDAQGRHTYQYVNLDGNWNSWFWGGYYFKISALDLSVGFNSNLSFSHSKAIVNGQANTTQNNNYGGGFSLSRNWKKGDKEVFSIEMEPGYTWHDYHASLSSALSSYWTANLSANLFALLPLKLELRSNAWYDLREQTQVFSQNNNVLRWDASIGRKFFKGNKLELRATIHDILNQNIGYSRDADVSSISESRYTTIRRHALLSLIYHFNGGTATQQTDDDDD